MSLIQQQDPELFEAMRLETAQAARQSRAHRERELLLRAR